MLKRIGAAFMLSMKCSPTTFAICRTADMQREQRIREITLLQNRIAHATRELETSNQLEMERVAIELELRRKCVLMAAVRGHLPPIHGH
jgi:hypothetical protein